jgi:hypothetical protein
MAQLSQESIAVRDVVAGRSKQAITSACSQVEAPLRYVTHTESRPFAYAYQPTAGIPQRSDADAVHRVTIRNARQADFSIDQEGFQLIRFPTDVRDFYDDDEIKSLYYPEVIRRLQQLTGATTVIISNHLVRNTSRPVHDKSAVREPSFTVHNDYTVISAPQRVRNLLEQAEAERLLRHRFAAINVWRPIRGPVKRTPLALCDAQSIQCGDLVATDLILRDRRSETYRLTYNVDHRWYYFPEMQQEEAILIKCYDSDAGRARFTAHAAFDDPNTPPDAPARESIEVRALLFFETDAV